MNLSAQDILDDLTYDMNDAESSKVNPNSAFGMHIGTSFGGIILNTESVPQFGIDSQSYSASLYPGTDAEAYVMWMVRNPEEPNADNYYIQLRKLGSRLRTQINRYRVDMHIGLSFYAFTGSPLARGPYATHGTGGFSGNGDANHYNNQYNGFGGALGKASGGSLMRGIFTKFIKWPWVYTAIIHKGGNYPLRAVAIGGSWDYYVKVQKNNAFSLPLSMDFNYAQYNFNPARTFLDEEIGNIFAFHVDGRNMWPIPYDCEMAYSWAEQPKNNEKANGVAAWVAIRKEVRGFSALHKWTPWLRLHYASSHFYTKFTEVGDANAVSLTYPIFSNTRTEYLWHMTGENHFNINSYAYFLRNTFHLFSDVGGVSVLFGRSYDIKKTRNSFSYRRRGLQVVSEEDDVVRDVRTGQILESLNSAQMVWISRHFYWEYVHPEYGSTTYSRKKYSLFQYSLAYRISDYFSFMKIPLYYSYGGTDSRVSFLQFFFKGGEVVDNPDNEQYLLTISGHFMAIGLTDDIYLHLSFSIAKYTFDDDLENKYMASEDDYGNIISGAQGGWIRTKETEISIGTSWYWDWMKVNLSLSRFYFKEVYSPQFDMDGYDATISFGFGI